MLNQALILAGGKGTRLGDLTKNTPKPLLDVNGFPFLVHLINFLKKQGITKVLVSTGFNSEKIHKYFQKNSIPGVELECIAEPKPLGTGGAIKNLESYLDEEFYVLNGDTLFKIKLDELPDITINNECICSIALRKSNLKGRFGQVELKNDFITKFAEKDSNNTNTDLINGGIYKMNSRILNLLPSGQSSLESDIFPELAKQSLLLGKEFKEYFIDIGVPEEFQRAQKELSLDFSILSEK